MLAAARPPARARRWRSTRATRLPEGARTTSRRACARPSARCAWAAHAPHATILSGSACCVYGLTFTSHFYGARRSVGYVPFNSETLVTGKLFEDIREAVHAQADPAQYDAIVIINLCVPTASGVPLQLLPKQINGVRIIGIDVPGFGVPTHAEAKDVLAGAMLRTPAPRPKPGPVAAPRNGVSDKPTVTLLGEMFPADPVGIGMLLEPMGLAAGPVVPTREWRELYAALDCAAVAAIHPFYTASVREFEAAGRTHRGLGAGRPRRHRSLAAGHRHAANVPQAQDRRGQEPFLPAIRGALARTPIKGRITLSGYEGSELLVARLLVESGADLPTWAPPARAHPGASPTANGCRRAACMCSTAPALEQDLAAVREFRPDLAIGTTPVVQAAKEARIPALYFTNLISARPLMGPAGAGSLARWSTPPSATRRASSHERLLRRCGAGRQGRRLGRQPVMRPEFRAETRASSSSSAKKRKAEEMI
jgi:chlorophyllide a reductase subunit Y